MTISGLASHLRWVEHYWFGVHLLGGETTVRGPEEDPDREMRIAVGIPVSQLLGEGTVRARYGTGRLVVQAAERLVCLALPGSGSPCPEPGIG